MTISDQTLKAMIRDFHGFDLSDEELTLVRPELEYYLEQLEIIAELDLADVFSSRLLRVEEGGQSHA